MRIGPVILTLILVSLVGFYFWQNFPPSTNPAIALQDEDPQVREAAARELGRTGSETALEPLIVALQDDEARVREAAAFGIGFLFSPRDNNQHLITDPDVSIKATEALLLASKERSLHLYSVGALVSIGAPALEILFGALQDADPHVREAAASAMQHIVPAIEEPHSRAMLVVSLLNVMKETDRRVQGITAATLVQIGELALEPLLQTVLEEDCGRRICEDLCSIEALVIREILVARRDGELTRRIIGLFIGRLSDETQSPSKRADAAYVLGQILWGFKDSSSRHSADPVLISSLNDSSEEVRVEAVIALSLVLSGSDDPDSIFEAADPLLKALQDDSPIVRERVIYALGATLAAVKELTGVQEIEQSLIIMLKDPDETDAVRHAAAWALCKIETEEANNAILNAGFDPEHPPLPRARSAL